MKEIKKFFYTRIFNIFLISSLIFTNLLLAVPVLADASLLQTDESGQYMINTVEDLNNFRKAVNTDTFEGKTAVLTKDIDVGDFKLEQTTGTFQGTFNGQGHKISGFNDVYSGLFCDIGSSAIVANLHLNMNVVGAIGTSSSYVSDSLLYGSIANTSSKGKINFCSVDGNITSTSTSISIGGVVGYVKSSSSLGALVENCYSRADIDVPNTETARVGGVTYYSIYAKAINNCYVSGNLQGNLVYPIARNNPTTAPYSTSYYNGEKIQPTTTPQAGISKTEAEMKQQSTYSNWDFSTVWNIAENVNDGYPYLRADQAVQSAVTMPVDVNINIADKTVNADGTVDLTASYTTSLTCSDQDSITANNVQVTLPGTINFPGFTGSNVTMQYIPVVNGTPVDLTSDVLKSNLKLTYADNQKYKFEIGNVTFNSPNFNGNGITTVSDTEKADQITNAKKAENTLYSSLAAKLGIDKVSDFSWSGDGVPVGGTEGSIAFSDADWGVFSAARSGYTGIPSGFYDDWFKSIQTGLQNMKAAGITVQDVKKTEWEKLVLAITSIGYDPRDIEAYDLIDIISNENFKSNQTFAEQYAVLALNSYNYAVPSTGNRINKEAWIHQWAKDALGTTGADGSTITGNSVSDMWIMKFQPIAAYYDPNAKEGDKYYDVKQAMEHVFDQCSNSQTYKGSFWGGMPGDYNNPWTNAQVYMTLGMAKRDIFDSKYIKNGNTMIDAALEKFDVGSGSTQYNNSTYDPSQICRGIDSFIRAYGGKNSIFDCTDVTDSTVPVNNAILALPDSITAANKTEVEAANTLYNALSDVKKTSIKQSTKDKLTAALANMSNPGGNTSVTGISLDQTSVNIKPGGTAQLTATIAPDNASNKNITWTSSDTSIATVDGDGKITAAAEGTATIKAVPVDNTNINAQCNVIVSNDTTPKPIIITNLAPNTSFNLGDDAKISVKAENNSGSDQAVSLILALYDNNDKFVNYVSGSQTIKNGDSSILTDMMKLPEQGLYKLKAFVWDSLENMNPLSDTIEIPIGSK
ncbi:Ig-like domain-containing protein [Clostridiaceae bacterium UIB06]|uniref:Ig-like domain-containing protein n=1 Tax=Clostridium thailandense TaxID=2794346 RepID=A0A949TX80_9CLOT|nr:Ig-like domain-containing protein [Clostridium thailandense]MBV7275201.1 Ig-like domain-containing protein [Clostridium thailandense]MCH5136837.1 Ig-like domain-containing protein [Clostridiaceae bacterium UIB06]